MRRFHPKSSTSDGYLPCANPPGAIFGQDRRAFLPSTALCDSVTTIFKNRRPRRNRLVLFASAQL